MIASTKFITDYKGRRVIVHSDKLSDKTGVVTNIIRTLGEESCFIELDNVIVINTRYVTYLEVIG